MQYAIRLKWFAGMYTTALRYCPSSEAGRSLDAGSGAGLPGVVLAIARPDLHCVLLDRAAKKVRFLVQCVADLGLENGEPVRARIQDYRSAQRFSTIVSRAAFALADLWRTSEGLLEPEGRALVMKASRPTEAELAGLNARGGEVSRRPLPGSRVRRHASRGSHGTRVRERLVSGPAMILSVEWKAWLTIPCPRSLRSRITKAG